MNETTPANLTVPAVGRAATVVRGPARSGKTAYLVERAARLLGEGADPARMLVVACNRDACAEVRRRLVAAVDPQLRGAVGLVRMATALELALEVLAAARANGWGGGLARFVRPLLDVELKVLLSDAGVPTALGLAVLDAACELRGRGAGVEEVRAGLDAEARAMLDAMSARFERLGAAPSAEIVARAAEVAEAWRTRVGAGMLVGGVTLAGAVAPAGGVLPAGSMAPAEAHAPTWVVEYLLVDDAESLSPAAQRLCRALGSVACSLVVAEDPTLPVRVREAHPAGSSMLDGVPAEGIVLGPAAVPIDAIYLKWETPDQEQAGIAAYIQHLVRTDPTLSPRDVMIVAPSRAWAAQMTRALDRRYLQADVAYGGQTIGGDPRCEHRAAALSAFVRLNLALDPTDLASWRIWCALDDPMLRRAEWTRLEEMACERVVRMPVQTDYPRSEDAAENVRGIGLGEQPAELALLSVAARGDDAAMADACPGLVSRYGALVPQLPSLARKRGFTLVKSLVGEGADALVERLFGVLDGDEDACELHRRLVARAFDTGASDLVNRVRICSAENVRGRRPRVLVIASLVDGVVPSSTVLNDERELEVQRLRFIYALVQPSDQLVLSTVRYLDVADARTAAVPFRRTATVGIAEYAAVRPSRFIDDLADAAPPQLSGPQLLAALGIDRL